MYVCLAFSSVMFIFTASYFKKDLKPYEIWKNSISFAACSRAKLCTPPCSVLMGFFSAKSRCTINSDFRKQPGPPSCAHGIVL